MDSGRGGFGRGERSGSWPRYEEEEQVTNVEFQFESTPAVTTSPPEQLSAAELRARYEEEVDIDEAVGGMEQVSISSIPQRQGRPVGIREDDESDDEEVTGPSIGRGRGTFGRGSAPKSKPMGDVGEPIKKVVSPTSGVAKPFHFGMRAATPAAPARPPRPPPPAVVEDEPVVLLKEESSEPIEAVIPPEDLEPVVVVAQQAPGEGQQEQEQANPIGDEGESSHSVVSSHGDSQTTPTVSKSKRGGGAVVTSSSGRGRGKMAPEEVGIEAPKAPLGQQPAAAVRTEEAPTLAPQARAPMVRRGAKGEEITVATNYIRLRFIGNCTIHEYHVDFDPPLDSTTMKKRSVRAVMGDRTYTFDGTMLFTAVKFDDHVTELKGFHPNSPDTELKIIAVYVKERPAYTMIQFINIMFKGVMKALGRVMLRRNYYDVKGVKSLPQHKLDIWPGYCIAVDEQEGGLMLCLDASHRVLRQETIYQQMCAMRTLGPDWKAKFAEFAVGKIVLTRFNNASYKIDDIWWHASPKDEFLRKDQMVTYAEYYKEHHGLQIQYPDQPMLVSRIKPRRGDAIQEDKLVVLVPELCFVTGLTEDQRSNFTVMKDLGEHTRLNPGQRRIALEKFIKEVNGTPEAKAILTKWNLEMENIPLTMKARIHAGPALNFGKKQLAAAGADFSRDALSGVVQPVHVNKYLLICTQRDSDKARRFVDQYRKACMQLGIQVASAPEVVATKGHQISDFRQAIKSNLTRDKYHFLFVLMPQQREDVYGMIKKLSLCELEVPSQCCLTKTLSNDKKFNSVVQKIALQINCKLGGSLWSLSLPFKNPMMFVGIDVAHDPLKKDASVLGLVATLNNECTRYVSICRVLKVHQEVADNLRSAFEEAMEAFNVEQGCYPVRVIVWRDGGLADPKTFNQHESKQVLDVVKEKCVPNTSFSYVVVQKRIPQRFFQITGRNWENPHPGTVIDHTVTRFDSYDFYIVSQLGTVTPTHYTVIEDVGETKPDLSQKFAYVSSFMYYNWPGTVRVPAMTQYAHKLASLVGGSIRAAPGTSLRESLYYL
ncbi:Protein argonaute-3 [Folsomia candida]|uniref:Protein argonaute-3 n=1 Tax=Folsomia candida TaxID=158441 RepID=A0A226F2V3_FOLCA|nr:Protein argonaute-3 [Folsomia candida]